VNNKIKEALELGLSLAQLSHHRQLFNECLLEIESEKPSDDADEAQRAHEEIASLCFRAGIDTPDGSSVGAVKSIIEAFTKLQSRTAELEKELATPILVKMARLADQLSKERERSEGLVEAMRKISKANRSPHSYMTAYAVVVEEAREALAKYQ